MDDPAKRDWRRKIKTRASSLAGGLLFLRPIRPATASKPPLYPCPSVVHISPPTAQRPWLLKSNQLSLGVLGGQSLQAEKNLLLISDDHNILQTSFFSPSPPSSLTRSLPLGSPFGPTFGCSISKTPPFRLWLNFSALWLNPLKQEQIPYYCGIFQQ